MKGNVLNYYVLPYRIPHGYNVYHVTSQALGVFIPHCSPNVSTIHDLFMLESRVGTSLPSPHDVVYSEFARRSIKKTAESDAVIAPSDHTAEQITRLLGVPRNKIMVVPMGVDHTVFGVRDKQVCRGELGLPVDKRIVLNIGSEDPRKNIPGILSAFARVLRKVPDALLIRVGKSSHVTRSRISALNLSSRVRYMSNLSDYRLAQLCSAADAYCTLSFQEGFGLTALEAMSTGCPTIGSTGTALEEVIGDAGLLVAPDDTDGAANLLAEVLSDNSKQKSVSSSCLERSMNYSWERCADATQRVYESVAFVERRPNSAMNPDVDAAKVL